MLKATSRAKKQDLGLTVTRATRDARKVVMSGPEMPGVFATVESHFGYDLDADIPTVITTITFPENRRGADVLAFALRDRIEPMGMVVDSTRIVITRKR